MYSYQEAKSRLVEFLSQDVEYHRANQFLAIGEHFDEFDGNLPRNGLPEFEKLHIALRFWDSWQDARNHEWQYYPRIGVDDWPILAFSIIKDVSMDREISNKLVLEEFDSR